MEHIRLDGRNLGPLVSCESGEGSPKAIPIELLPPEGREAALDAIKKTTKVRGQQPAPIWSIIGAGPPRFDDPDAWPKERVVEWGQAFADFFRRHFPHSMIERVMIHCDELAPHIHILMTLKNSRGELGRTRPFRSPWASRSSSTCGRTTRSTSRCCRTCSTRKSASSSAWEEAARATRSTARSWKSRFLS